MPKNGSVSPNNTKVSLKISWILKYTDCSVIDVYGGSYSLEADAPKAVELTLYISPKEHGSFIGATVKFTISELKNYMLV